MHASKERKKSKIFALTADIAFSVYGAVFFHLLNNLRCCKDKEIIWTQHKKVSDYLTLMLLKDLTLQPSAWLRVDLFAW